MEILLVLLGLLGSIAFLATIWYLIRWVIGKADRKPIFRKRFFISIIVFIIGIVSVGVLGSQQNDKEAARLGFVSTQDYLAAKKNGISDPEVWAVGAAQREAEENQRIADQEAEAARVKQEAEGQAKAEAEAKAEQERKAAEAENERAAKEQAKSDFFAQPDQQVQFVEAITKARTAMKDAANDLAKGGIRRNRLQDICGIIASGQIKRWSGTITNLTTNGDGLGVVSVEIGNRVWFKTWNNSLSDIADSTMIDPGSQLFAKLSTLKEGDIVVFDAKLIRTPTGPDCYREASLTFDGSMRSPEFIAKFRSIETFEGN